MINKTQGENMYSRTEMLLGEEGVEGLKRAHVIIFGVGGVGGYAAEALCRAGVGSLTLVDSDRVAPSNLNRQIIATVSTVGKLKVEAAKERMLDINPSVKIDTVAEFYSEENKESFNLSEYDFVLDCIDSVRSKLCLIESAVLSGTPIISSMGAGNKLDPTRFTVTDISKTHTDPLAKVIRTELRKKGINHLTVVFSDEMPKSQGRDRVPGSVSFVPSVAGLIMAGEVAKRIAEI